MPDIILVCRPIFGLNAVHLELYGGVIGGINRICLLRTRIKDAHVPALRIKTLLGRTDFYCRRGRLAETLAKHISQGAVDGYLICRSSLFVPFNVYMVSRWIHL